MRRTVSSCMISTNHIPCERLSGLCRALHCTNCCLMVIKQGLDKHSFQHWEIKQCEYTRQHLTLMCIYAVIEGKSRVKCVFCPKIKVGGSSLVDMVAAARSCRLSECSCVWKCMTCCLQERSLILHLTLDSLTFINWTTKQDMRVKRW